MNSNKRVILSTVALLAGLVLWPELHSHPVRAQTSGLTGSYGYALAISNLGSDNVPGVLQGVVTLDGAGNATTSSAVLVARNPDPTAVGPLVQPQDADQGTYTLNPDGTGTLTFPNPNGTATSISFVVTDGGAQLMLAATSGLGNALATGTARKR